MQRAAKKARWPRTWQCCRSTSNRRCPQLPTPCHTSAAFLFLRLCNRRRRRRRKNCEENQLKIFNQRRALGNWSGGEFTYNFRSFIHLPPHVAFTWGSQHKADVRSAWPIRMALVFDAVAAACCANRHDRKQTPKQPTESIEQHLCRHFLSLLRTRSYSHRS